MPVGRSADGRKLWQRRSTAAQWLGWGLWLAIAMLFAVSWGIMTRDTIWSFVADAPRQGADIAARMVPPRWSYLDRLWRPLWDTLNIATLGTLLAILLAVPVAFLAARNTSPSLLVARPLALFVIVASRSINSLIWALLLVAVIGPGLLAGIIAIALRSVGFIGKLLYEAIEEIDAAQVEAIAATGAPRCRSSTTASSPRSCPPSPASASSAGTSTSANRRSWAWSAPAASASSSKRPSTRSPGPR